MTARRACLDAFVSRGRAGGVHEPVRLHPPDARQLTPASARALGGSLASADPAELQKDDGQWVMPAKNYASTRFSGLNEITTGNVSQLGVAWTFSTGMVSGHEAAPLVVGSTMFVVTPFPNLVYAFDLSQPGAPIKWQYDPKPLGAAKGVACCDVVNRGAAYADGSIFFNTLDGRTIALDAQTGRPRWITQLADLNRGETMTMAPLVVKGKVLVGNSGGEFGVRGWLTALDAASGSIAWRAYSTGPDKDVLIGPSFKPHYASDRGTDLGMTTWPGEAWRTGGGTVWGWISYDPELNLVYYGTANPGPWNPEQRPGDNKWTAGIFARVPETGEARWFYQTSPHDLFDHDGVNELVLADLSVNGQTRKGAMRADLWIWHLPALYQAALGDAGIHAVQHLSFVLTASLFWWAMAHGRYGRQGYGLAVVYVFLTALHSGALGALLTVAPSPWYRYYVNQGAAWRVDALGDQQLAGLLMWVPAGVVFILLGLALFAAWMGEAERRVRFGATDTASR